MNNENHKWNDLQKVYEKCNNAGVSFSLNYEESAGTWYFTITSAATSENFVGKSRNFNGALSSAMEWLDGISGIENIK